MCAHACKILVCAHAYKLLIGNIVITKEDVQAGVNDDASFFPAMMDVFIGVTALFVAWGGWRGKGWPGGHTRTIDTLSRFSSRARIVRSSYARPMKRSGGTTTPGVNGLANAWGAAGGATTAGSTGAIAAGTGVVAGGCAASSARRASSATSAARKSLISSSTPASV